MKEPYRWNYDIKIITKDGKAVSEQWDDILTLEQKVLSKYPNYKSFVAHHIETDDNEYTQQNNKEDKGKSLIKKITPRK